MTVSPVDLVAFKKTLSAPKPPADLAPPLTALWWEAKGDWAKAHEVAQEHEHDKACAWVHAYLHRVEGDLANAGYWYRQAGHPPATGALKTEWDAIVTSLVQPRP